MEKGSMKKLKICAWIAIFWVLILWELFSTHIVTKYWFNHEINIQTISEIEDERKYLVYWGINDFSVQHNMGRTVVVSGWIVSPDYIAAKSAKNEQPIFENYIVLSGAGASYMMTPSIWMRTDIGSEYIISRGIPIPEAEFKFGYNIEFSPLDFKDGMYELLLAIMDADSLIGYAHTGQYLYVNKNEIYTSTYRAVEEKDPKAVNSSKPNYAHLDEITPIDDQYTRVSGWEYADNCNCKDQAIYIEIIKKDGTKETFLLSRYTRSDIAEATQDINYLESGFCGVVPVNFDEIYSYNLFASEENDVIYSLKLDTML